MNRSWQSIGGCNKTKKRNHSSRKLNFRFFTALNLIFSRNAVRSFCGDEHCGVISVVMLLHPNKMDSLFAAPALSFFEPNEQARDNDVSLLEGL